MQTLDNYPVISRQTIGNDLLVLDNITKQNASFLGNVLIIDNHDVVAVLVLGNSSLRNQYRQLRIFLADADINIDNLTFSS